MNGVRELEAIAGNSSWPEGTAFISVRSKQSVPFSPGTAAPSEATLSASVSDCVVTAGRPAMSADCTDTL